MRAPFWIILLALSVAAATPPPVVSLTTGQIRGANLDDLTPREAVQLLHGWQERLAAEQPAVKLPR